MTLADIEKSTKDFLTAEDIAPYLKSNPDIIRWQAQHNSEKLGFPVIVAKSRVKIPRIGFLFFCKHGRPLFNDLSSAEFNRMVQQHVK